MIRTFRARLALLTAAAALVPALVILLAGSALVSDRLRSYLEGTARADLAARAESFQQALEQVLTEARGLAAALAEVPAATRGARNPAELVQALAAHPRTDVRAHAEMHYASVLRLTLLGAGGEPLAAVQPEYGEDHRLRARVLEGEALGAARLPEPQWRQLQELGSLVSPVHETGNVPFVRCAARVELPPLEEAPIAAVVLDVRLQSLLPGGRQTLGWQALFFVLDSSGVIVSHPDPAARGRPLALVDGALARAAAESAGGGARWIERGGRRSLLCVATLASPPGPLRTALLADVEDLLRGLGHAVGLGLLLALAAGVLVALAAWRLNLHLARAVESLGAGARRLGGGDLTARLREDRRDELGELARAFNRMAAELETAMRAVAERARLEERDRMRRELLANVSHDLRTPLTAIRWSVENLQAGVAGPLTENQADYLSGIHESASHLLVLIEDLLSLARLEAGRLALQKEDLSVGAAAAEAAAMLQPLALRKSVEVRIAGAARARADRERLRQVFANLLDNAVRHSPERGRVTVAIGPGTGGSGARVSVSDQGAGVPAEQREAIFERFRSQSGAGLGIGLHLSRSLVRLHGGDLWAEESDGGGARFVFTLPGDGG